MGHQLGGHQVAALEERLTQEKMRGGNSWLRGEVPR